MHRPDEEGDRCVCGGEIVYFEDTDPPGEGCSSTDAPWAAKTIATTVEKAPSCQFPHSASVAATVDGKTVDGPWAYMCATHHLSHGVGLGIGRGQLLSNKETK